MCGTELSTCQGHTMNWLNIGGIFPKKVMTWLNCKVLSTTTRWARWWQKAKTWAISLQCQKLADVLAPLPKFVASGVNSLSAQQCRVLYFTRLGYALAWGNEYLNKLIEAEFRLHRLQKIKFNFGYQLQLLHGNRQIPRRTYVIWASLTNTNPNDWESPEQQNVIAMQKHLHSTHSLFDAHVNLLRSRTENNTSAALAGVNSITVTPFDKTYKLRMISRNALHRNQQLLLKKNVILIRYRRPGCRFLFIENLTVSIAKTSMGLVPSMWKKKAVCWKLSKAASVQEAINASNKARHDAVSKRKRGLLGTSQFPNFQWTGKQAKRTIGSTLLLPGNSAHEKPSQPFNFNRAASEFETRRLQTERSGKRPKAFMLTMAIWLYVRHVHSSLVTSWLVQVMKWLTTRLPHCRRRCSCNESRCRHRSDLFERWWICRICCSGIQKRSTDAPCLS